MGHGRGATRIRPGAPRTRFKTRVGGARRGRSSSHQGHRNFGGIPRGIGQYIAANKEGGFDAFLRELAAYDPDVIAFGPTGGHPTKLLIDWIAARYQRIHVGPITFFVRKGDARLNTPAP